MSTSLQYGLYTSIYLFAVSHNVSIQNLVGQASRPARQCFCKKVYLRNSVMYEFSSIPGGGVTSYTGLFLATFAASVMTAWEPWISTTVCHLQVLCGVERGFYEVAGMRCKGELVMIVLDIRMGT